MTKINIATHLNHVYTDAVRAWLEGRCIGGVLLGDAAAPEQVEFLGRNLAV